jgi:hypothetical protein
MSQKGRVFLLQVACSIASFLAVFEACLLSTMFYFDGLDGAFRELEGIAVSNFKQYVRNCR